MVREIADPTKSPQVINMISSQTAAVEMDALASLCPRCQSPFVRCSIVWRPGEIPTEKDASDAVELLMHELECERCPCIWSMKKNRTSNAVEMIFLRIDPDERTPINPASGWTKKASERAARRIENGQGWKSTDNARTLWLPGGFSGSVRGTANGEKLSQRATAAERLTGEKSTRRVAREAARESDISSWQAFHASLLSRGLEYQKTARGASFVRVDSTTNRRSSVSDRSVGPEFELAQLEKNLGPFEPPEEQLRASPSPRERADPRADDVVIELLPTERSFVREPAPYELVIRGFVRDDWGRYRANGARRAAFADRGDRIELFTADDAALVAASKLAAVRWARAEASGPSEPSKRCAVLAELNGISIIPMKQQKLRLLSEDWKKTALCTFPFDLLPDGAAPSPALDSVEAIRLCLAALRAERAHLMVVSVSGKIARRFWSLGAVFGAPDGFSADEIEALERRTRLIARLAGEASDARHDIACVPVEDEKNFLTISGLTSASLLRVSNDGFRPSAVITDSRGRSDALFALPTIDRELDRRVCAMTSSTLNKRYGAVSGHLINFPSGFWIPGVRGRAVVRTRSAGCRELEEEARRAHAAIAEDRARAGQLVDELERCVVSGTIRADGGSVAVAREYCAIYKEIYESFEPRRNSLERVSPSRIDAASALEMRECGRDEAETRRAVELVAPFASALHGGAHRADWGEYAAQIAGYAFSDQGTADIDAEHRSRVALGRITDRDAMKLSRRASEIEASRGAFITSTTEHDVAALERDRSASEARARADLEAAERSRDEIAAAPPEPESISEKLFGVSRKRRDEHQQMLKQAVLAADEARYALICVADRIDFATKVAALKNEAIKNFDVEFPEEARELDDIRRILSAHGERSR